MADKEEEKKETAEESYREMRRRLRKSIAYTCAHLSIQSLELVEIVADNLYSEFENNGRTLSWEGEEEMTDEDT